MDLGDIIYILVLFSFFIFGFIKDIKKKEASKQQKLPQNIPSPESIDKKKKSATVTSQKQRNKVVPPPVPNFDTVGQYKYEGTSSTIPSYALEGHSALQNRETIGHFTQKEDNSSVITKNKWHPILEDLTGENRSEELRKAVIYNEIINRRY